MRIKVKTIGIVLETKEEAMQLENAAIENSYHWREPEEIETITETLSNLGFRVELIGSPFRLCRELNKYIGKIDFILNLSVGFRKRFRLSLGPSLYELAGIPYSGADPYTKMASQNKHLMKSFWDKLGIPTPQWAFVDSKSNLRQMQFPDFPCIVKPAYEGSSIGLDERSVVRSAGELYNRIESIREGLDMPVIVEQFISGKEIKVGIVGDSQNRFAVAIEDTCDGESLGDRFLHFRVKTDGAMGKRKWEPTKPILEQCKRIYEMFEPVDYGTFDIRIDEQGNHTFLEFNADATLHPKRTLAQCCIQNGISYEGLIQSILESAFRRWKIG